MPLPLPGPTGLWEGTGSRCSGLLLAADLGLRQGLQKKHSGAPPQHEVQTIHSQTSPGGRAGQGRRHSDGGANPRLALIFLLLPDNLDSTAEKRHCQVWVSAWWGRAGRLSLVELLARAVSMVQEQLAWGKLCSIGRLILP